MILRRVLLLLALAPPLFACGDDGVRSRRDPPDAGGSFCGDGRITEGEECDGSNLGGASCTSLGYDTGTLTCDGQCQFIEFACVKFCGNGLLDTGEECDGDAGPLACGDWGYKSCSVECKVDPAHCRTQAFRNGPSVVLEHGGPAVISDLIPAGRAELITADPEFFRLQIHEYDLVTGFDFKTFVSRQNDGAQPTFPIAGDLDGDGNPDLAAVNADGTAGRYRYVPPGQSLPDGGAPVAFPRYALQGLPHSPDAGACEFGGWVGAANLDGDGALDLVSLACKGSRAIETFVAVGIHRGAPVPGPAELVSHPDFVSAALGDVDGDGQLDLVFLEAQAQVSYARGPGFTEVVTRELLAQGLDVSAGDLDGDGDADLALATAGDVRVLENGGAGFAEVRTFAGAVAHEIAIADLDLDGRLDLVWLEQGSVQVRRNLGDSVFADHPIQTGAGAPVSMALGDFEGDGDLDIAAVVAGPAGAPATVTHVLVNLVR